MRHYKMHYIFVLVNVSFDLIICTGFEFMFVVLMNLINVLLHS